MFESEGLIYVKVKEIAPMNRTNNSERIDLGDVSGAIIYYLKKCGGNRKNRKFHDANLFES